MTPKTYPAGIVVHAHGGVVSKTDGEAKAQRLKEEYRAAGAFPIFFVWESGLLETVSNNLSDISEESLFHQLSAKVLSFVLKQVGAVAGYSFRDAKPTDPIVTTDDVLRQLDTWYSQGLPSGSPPFDEFELNRSHPEDLETLEQSIHSDVINDVPLRRALLAVSEQMVPEGEAPVVRGTSRHKSTATLMSPDALARLLEPTQPGKRGIISFLALTKTVASIVLRVVRRLIRSRDHGVYTTVVEELLRELYLDNIGKTWFWDQMKKDCRDAFGDDPERHGGTALLKQFGRLGETSGRPRVTLVAHSAGSYFVCEFLEHVVRWMTADFRCNVVLLAPAVTCRQFAHTLRRHGQHIERLVLFSMCDELERKDCFARVIYPRSALYFVSGLLEDQPDEPILGMQRFLIESSPLASDADVSYIRSWLAERPGSTVWSICDEGQGLRSAASSHSAFDDERQTLDSVRHFLRQELATNREETTSQQEKLPERPQPALSAVEPPTRREGGFLDFEIEIGAGRDNEYPVFGRAHSLGEVQAVLQFPFSKDVLRDHLHVLEKALLRSGSPQRKVFSPEEKAVQAFGRKLFDAVFCGSVGELYRRACSEAGKEQTGVRLRLFCRSPELANVPWEFLYDEREGDFVSLSWKTPIVRYVEVPQPSQPLRIASPLRILGMISHPTDLTPLDVEREREHIERAIRPLGSRAELVWLSGSTWRDLQKVLHEGPWHVFHFIGHGQFDPIEDEGIIALEDDESNAHFLSATKLARLLNDHHSLRLVILNSCEGARGSQRDIFSSPASALVRRGISAGVGMQYEISDGAAQEFARSFYEYLTTTYAVDKAVSEARKAISIAGGKTFEWATPVLYLRSADGVLFEQTTQPEAERPQEAPPPPRVELVKEQPPVETQRVEPQQEVDPPKVIESEPFLVGPLYQTRCPDCLVEVQIRNIHSHFKKVHPGKKPMQLVDDAWKGFRLSQTQADRERAVQCQICKETLEKSAILLHWGHHVESVESSLPLPTSSQQQPSTSTGSRPGAASPKTANLGPLAVASSYLTPCPYCQVAVRLGNMQSHLQKVHRGEKTPDQQLDDTWKAFRKSQQPADRERRIVCGGCRETIVRGALLSHWKQHEVPVRKRSSQTQQQGTDESSKTEIREAGLRRMLLSGLLSIVCFGLIWVLAQAKSDNGFLIALGAVLGLTGLCALGPAVSGLEQWVTGVEDNPSS